MSDWEDSDFDEEEFIRSNLSFLNDSDESSEASSGRFESLEDIGSRYGCSPNPSLLSGIWSGSSSLSSPLETSNLHPKSTSFFPQNKPVFPREEWYDPHSFTDLGGVTNSFLPGQREYNNLQSTVNTNVQYNNSQQFYSSLTSNISSYSHPNAVIQNSTTLTTTIQQIPQNYLPPLTTTVNQTLNEWPNVSNNNAYKGGYMPHHISGAEEALNNYFATQSRSRIPKQCDDLNFNTVDRNFSSGDFYPKRTPPSQNKSVKNKGSQQMNTFEIEKLSLSNPVDVKPASNTARNEVACQTQDVGEFGNKSPQTKPILTEYSTKAKIVPQNQTVNSQCQFCRFCYKNGELSEVYMSHITKLPDGSIACPVLKKYVCDLCGATGNNAHTRKYCSLNTKQMKKQPIFRRLTNGVLTSSHNHK